MYTICCPFYKEQFSLFEETNIKITEFYNKEVDKYFLLPQKINIDYYRDKFPNWKIIQIEDYHFEGIKAYNKLMLSNKVYQIFLKYKYLVINQCDAVLLTNINSLNFNYDYIGAPWINPINYCKLDLYIGNGGLSIRKTKTFYIITTLAFFIKKLNANEDVIFSFLGKIKILKLPKIDFAASFFCEIGAIKLKNWDNIIGFHALEKWNPDLQEKIFKFHNNI